MKHRFQKLTCRLQRYSGKKGLIVIFIFLIMLPTCLVIYFYYIKSSDIIEQEVTQSILQTLRQASINIENRLTNVENISESFFINKEVMEFVGEQNNNDIPLQSQQEQDIRSRFEAQISHNNALHIRMFLDMKKIVTGESVNFFPLNEIKNKGWYKGAVDRKGGIYWTSVYNQSYLQEGSCNIVSCARVLKHTYNYNDFRGILLIDINESDLYSVLSEIHTGRGEKLFMVDDSGKVISGGNKQELGKLEVSADELKLLNSNDSGVGKIYENGTAYNIIYQTVRNTNWKLVDKINRADIIRTNLIFSNISVFVVIVGCFIFLVFGIFLMIIQIMDQLNRQVKKLALDIEKEGVEIIEERTENNSHGDYIKLETYVYGMIRKVKELMEESYQSRIREREAQLTALQAQINPHFLYNTLDAINWMAVKIDAREISFMINSLARYFRLSLSKGKTVVSIHDELELINVYLTIQNIRYQGMIQFEFRVEEEIKNYKILKLTLQPIIENAILHGIQKKEDRHGTITIKGAKSSDDIVISIADDGVGINAETIQSIMRGTWAEHEGHYGLYNVNERLKLYYGSDYGISITSEPGKGTCVEVKIKAL